MMGEKAQKFHTQKRENFFKEKKRKTIFSFWITDYFQTRQINKYTVNTYGIRNNIGKHKIFTPPFRQLFSKFYIFHCFKSLNTKMPEFCMLIFSQISWVDADKMRRQFFTLKQWINMTRMCYELQKTNSKFFPQKMFPFFFCQNKRDWDEYEIYFKVNQMKWKRSRSRWWAGVKGKSWKMYDNYARRMDEMRGSRETNRE